MPRLILVNPPVTHSTAPPPSQRPSAQMPKLDNADLEAAPEGRPPA